MYIEFDQCNISILILINAQKTKFHIVCSHLLWNYVIMTTTVYPTLEYCPNESKGFADYTVDSQEISWNFANTIL